MHFILDHNVSVGFDFASVEFDLSFVRASWVNCWNMRALLMLCLYTVSNKCYNCGDMFCSDMFFVFCCLRHCFFVLSELDPPTRLLNPSGNARTENALCNATS